MKKGLDFIQIRPYKGSQHSGFEQLICQLAHLSRPKNAECFIRKEGSGGDAGVECFWKLKDGSEHAWQAKYFTDNLQNAQWIQISKSVKTALDKHSNLKKYYVCLPKDRTPREIKKWEQEERKWKTLADSKRMSVEFVFWGEHEIHQKLSTDDSRFSGKALYWFNSPILRIKHLKDIAEKAKKSLGDRFSPECHVELSIAKSFEGVGLTPNWYKRFYSVTEKWLEALEELKNIISEEDEHLTEERWNPIKEHSIKLEVLLKQTVKTYSLYENRNQLKEAIIGLTENTKTKMDYTETETVKKINWYFNLFSDATHKLSKFFFSKDMMAFSIKSMLLSGDAGAGKSHLLCDITLNRLKNNLPTLFLLGQHYKGGDPLKFISDALDLNNNSHKDILGALDALGKTHSTRTLIIIDAINEGPYKEEWQNYIEKLIIELCKYPHIALVFSCRSTYLQSLLPQIKNSGKKQNEAKLTVEIEHKGFSSLGDIYKYLEKQDIHMPNTPIMEPEFSNPLFLKIYCKSLKSKGEKLFSQGSRSIETIFDFYVDSISETINRNKKYRTGEKIVSKALQSFALKLFPDNLYGLQTNKARNIIQAEDPSPNTGDLFNELLNEGILSEDMISISHKVSELPSNKKENNPENEYEYRKEQIVRFTYERFSDYFIVKSLIEKEVYKKQKKLEKNINKIKYFFYRIISKEYCLDNENLKLYFRKGSALGDIFFSNKHWIFNGIIEALFTRIADNFKVELYDLIEIEDKQHLLEEPLKKSFLWRSSNSFTLRTFELLSQLQPIHFHSPILQILLKLSIKPDHPWNADLLHKILTNKTLAERDKLWSTHIFFSYHYGEDLTIKNLIDWPYSANLQNLESERVRLYVMTLIWFTTSSYRELRDKATKSAIIILSKYPEHLLKLMNQFSEVNDLYVKERLYAIAYGVVVSIEDRDLVKKIAEKTYEQVFKTGKPVPHILLRDYARCILEFAYNQNLLSDQINPGSFRPPYKSDWPIENPMDSEIDALDSDEKYSSVRHSLMGFPADFGRYTMNCVHYFSPTISTEDRPETGIELQGKFEEILKQNKYYNEYIKKINSLEEETYKQISVLKSNFKDVPDHHKNSILWIPNLFGQESSRYNEYIEKLKKIQEEARKKIEPLEEKLKELLNEEQREYFRWVFGPTMNDRPAAFSRKWAQRWVCKQVYQMGWSKELFENFDTDHIFSLRYRGKEFIERIGKKYQWIAFHKLLAHLADNVHYIGHYDNNNKYKGPWQLSKRDIDPTCCFRKTGDDPQLKNTPKCWWQPYVTQFPEENIGKQEAWFNLKNIDFPFKDLFQAEDPKDNSFWTVLHSLVVQQKELSPDKKEEELYKPECWFKISAIIIYKKDLSVLCEKLNNKDIRNQDIAEGGRVTGFLKEYPFCDKEYNNDWKKDLLGNEVRLNIKHLRPVMEYNWESGNTDYSIDETISFYLPSKTLIDKLNLHCPPGQFECWVNNNKIPVFKDPSVTLNGPSCPLVKTNILNSWLKQDNLCLVWLIGGERRLYGKDMTGKKHAFSGVYFTNGDQIEGHMWFHDISRWGR